ncbi:MAG: cupredoxin domain-containing protein [Acidobacteria bacterium]|nr:cupredoxin domain-containing protein [Acidobacteriota bacterium]
MGKNITFDLNALTVPAGQEVTITFDNQDAAVPHNLHIQAGPEGDFKTEIVEGPVLQTLTFEIAKPGSYSFVCDVHPIQMAGTLVVE